MGREPLPVGAPEGIKFRVSRLFRYQAQGFEVSGPRCVLRIVVVLSFRLALRLYLGFQGFRGVFETLGVLRCR